MADVKMTQKDYFNEIIALAEANGRDDIVKFAEGRIDVLNRKSSGKKATKTQEANEGIKAVILEVLEKIGKGTVTDIMNADSELGALSNQKVSALLRQLVNDNKVDKSTEKRKSYFTIKGE